MKIKYLITFILFLLVSCWKDIDDTNKNCTSDCTTISGRIMTESGTIPVSGLDFQFDWVVKSELGGTYRNIKKFKTDNNGYFEFNFHATDLELNRGGGYSIKYLDSVKTFLNVYHPVGDFPFIGSVNIKSRDTLVNKTLWLPRRSCIRIKILNPTIKSGCNIYYKYGDISLDPSYNSGGYINSEEQSEKILEAAGNQINYLQIGKEINNQYVSFDDSIYVPVGDTITYIIK